MGNQQCGTPITSSGDVAVASMELNNNDNETAIQPIPYDAMMQHEQQFLKAHLSESKKRCILSTSDVIQAHVEQVEEFVRRTNIMKGKHNKDISLTADESTISDADYDENDTDTDDNTNTDNESHDGVSVGFHSINSFARITSYFAPTVVSAATEKAGNKHRTNNKKHNKKSNKNGSDKSSRKGTNSRYAISKKDTSMEQQQPRIVGGMEFVESETKRKKIQTIIVEFYHQSWFQRSMYILSPSSKSSTLSTISNSVIGRNFTACHTPLWNVNTNDDNNSITTTDHLSCLSPTLTEQVEIYSSVLHLRMKMKCYNYFQLHLLRRKPLEPFTRNIQNGIIKSSSTTSSFSPQSFQQHLHLCRSYQMKQPNGKHSRNQCSRKFVLPDLRDISSGEDTSSTGSPSGLDFGIGPPSSSVQLLVTNTVFIDLAVTGTLGLNPKKQRIRAAYIDRKVLLSPEDHIVLLNRRSGVPIAVCTLVTSITSHFPVVRMYATKRRVANQSAATNTRTLGITWTESLPLYTWAEFVTETIDPDDPVPTPQSYSIYFVSDVDDGTTLESAPKYRANVVASTPSTNSSSTTISSPIIQIIGRTSREFQMSGCATISMCADVTNDHVDRHGGSNHDTIYWKLSISQGIDPSVLICFNAFIDEIMERTMRWHCENKKK